LSTPIQPQIRAVSPQEQMQMQAQIFLAALQSWIQKRLRRNEEIFWKQIRDGNAGR
jgi:hypothetical protein